MTNLGIFVIVVSIRGAENMTLINIIKRKNTKKTQTQV